MKIAKRGISGKSKHSVSTKSWAVVFDDNAQVVELENNRTLVVEGEIYYCRFPDGRTHVTNDIKSETEIVELISSEDHPNISTFIEGMYVAAVLDKNNDSVIVMGDAFANVTIFYHEDDQNCTASTELSDILSQINDITYQQEALYCILILGYSPAKHTPYTDVRRLAYDEQLLFKAEKKTLIRPQVKEIKVRPMDESDLETYAELFQNSVLSRASEIENWVLISGGWDSTIMLATLCKHIDKSTIKPIVGKLLLPDGRCYNPYEVSKAQKIATYYGLDCEVADVWMSDENTYEHISGISQNLRSYLLYDWMPGLYAISKIIGEKGKKGAVVFHGAFSDALHNFGFSQFISLPYLSYDFREYSDKMRCYLYSPSFLTKILNSSSEDDFIFKLFWWHANSEQDLVENKNRKDALLNYLLSFVISDFRIPFARIAREWIFKEDAKESFKQWLYDNYFKEAVENINSENMYFYLIHLYKYFHLQGSENRVIQSSLEGTDFHPRRPFLDMGLAEFLAGMPEDWGRGLEWKQIKYPLKQYAIKHLDIPVTIIESDFHSYIDEKEDDERLIDWRAEMVNASPLGLNWRETSAQQIVDKIFDEGWFDIDAVKKQLSTACDASTSKLHLNLATFLTVGLEGT